MTTRGNRSHAVPGGESALKPPARDLPKPPDRPAAPGSIAQEVAPAAAPVGVGDASPPPPPPPPAARRHPREQLNTKIRVDLRGRLDGFVERHDSTLQGVLEAALDEYMARRGWTWNDYRDAQRRG